MQAILTRYRIDAVWHFTDRSNLALIQEHQGLLSLAESRRRGIKVPAPGGNDWSHDADEIKGVHEYVHLAFLDDHPMLYVAKKESRITDPVWLKIDASILFSWKMEPVLLTTYQTNQAYNFFTLRSPEILLSLKFCLRARIGRIQRSRQDV
jgi:hypothetical protein